MGFPPIGMTPVLWFAAAVASQNSPPLINPHLVYLTGGSNRITGQTPVWSERVGTLTLDVTSPNSAGQCRFNELVPFFEPRSKHGAAVVPYGDDQHALCMVGGIDNTSSDLPNYACNGIEPAFTPVANSPISYTGPAKDLAVATYHVAADNTTYVCRAGGYKAPTSSIPAAELACQPVGSGSATLWTVILNFFPISYGNTLHIKPVSADVITVFIIGGALSTDGLSKYIGKYHVDLTSETLMYTPDYPVTSSQVWATNIHGEQTGVAYHGSAIADDVLYVAGGCAGGFIATCNCSNRVTAYNTTLVAAGPNNLGITHMNTNRCGLDLLFAPEQNRLFAVGGYTTHTDFPGDTSLDTIEYYDIGGTGQWNEITCFPSGLQNIQHFSAVWAVDRGMLTVNPPSPIPCVITDANVLDLAQCLARDVNNATLCSPECTNASQWDTSLVTDFSVLFSDEGVFADLDISHQNFNGWDVSSVTDFSGLFDSTVLSADINLGAWNMSAAQFIDGMFQDSNFEGNGIESWDVSNVGDMATAFTGCNLSATLDLGNWNVSQTYRFTAAFLNNSNYKGVGINKWQIGVDNLLTPDTGITSTDYMFQDTAVTFVPDWVPTDNTTLWEMIVREMFGITATGPFNFPDGTAIPLPPSEKCVVTDANVLNLAQCLARDVNATLCSPECTNASQWDTSLVTSFFSHTASKGAFASLDISDQNINGWDVSSVTDFLGAFEATVLPVDINLGAWNMSTVQFIDGMFRDSNFEGNGIESWDVSNVKEMSNAFLSCNLSASLDLGQWNVGSVQGPESQGFYGTFYGNVHYAGVGLNNWNVHNSVLDQLSVQQPPSDVSLMLANTAVAFVPVWVPTDNTTLWEMIVREMFKITATGPFNFPDGTPITPLNRSSTTGPTAPTVPTASELPLFSSAPPGEKKATTVSRLYFLLFLLIIPAIVAYVYSINSKTASRARRPILGGPKNVIYHGLLET